MKGQGFRCGSDEKMMRMWFGLEIDVVGLPPLLVRFRYSDQVMGTHGSSSNMHGENSIEETSV